MSRRRGWLWTFAAFAFIIAATYALGGTSSFRRLRSRIRGWMEPPTASQIQQATAAAAQQAAIDSVRADSSDRAAAPPAAPLMILTVVGAAMGFTIAVLLVSTRWASRRDDERGA